jgi:hypothetical protein
MTNRQRTRTFGLSAFIGVVVLISITILAFQTFARVPANSADGACVGTPESQPTGTLNPDIDSSPPTPPADWVVPTQIPIAETIDLAPESADENKAWIYVWRCTGEMVVYRIDMFSDYTVVPLGEGDIIYTSAPAASLVGQQIRVSTDTPEPEVFDDTDTGTFPTAIQPETESTESAYP